MVEASIPSIGSSPVKSPSNITNSLNSAAPSPTRSVHFKHFTISIILKYLITITILNIIVVFKIQRLLIKLSMVICTVTLYALEAGLLVLVIVLQIEYGLSSTKNKVEIKKKDLKLLSITTMHELYWSGGNIGINQIDSDDLSQVNSFLKINNTNDDNLVDKSLKTNRPYNENQIPKYIVDKIPIDNKRSNNNLRSTIEIEMRKRKRLRDSFHRSQSEKVN